MKITFFLIILMTLGVFASAQNQKVSINLKDATVLDVLDQIRQQTGLRFIYNEDKINNLDPINVNVKNEEVVKVLTSIFKETQLTCLFKDNVIVLMNKNYDPRKMEQETEHIVKGKVTDEKGNPLPGVTILIKGTSSGVATDVEGKYSIRLYNDKAELVFSFIGMVSQTIIYKGQTLLNVTLKTDTKKIDEVVVTGYQTISKERVTGSYKTISSSKVKEVPTINILERLEGTVSGVNFDSKNNTISIRGTNSYSKTQPLIVVDGFPMPQEGFQFNEGKRFQGGADLSYLNPDDIESITILKDAAASSIWGSRAANGVIVIKTKRGKNNTEPIVSFSSSWSRSDKPYLGKLKQMNTSQYIDFEKELFELGFLTDNITDWTKSNLSEAQEWMFKVKRGTATESECNAALEEMSSRDNLGQIKKYLLRNATSKQYSLSVSGGSDKSSYFISGNYNNDNPVMKGNNSDSYSFTANNTIRLFKNAVTLRTGINYTSSKYNVNNTVNEALSTVSKSGLRPYDMIVDETGQGIDKYLLFRPEVIQDFENKGYLPWTYNYIDELNYSNLVLKSNAVRLNAELSSDITDWLNVSASGMYYKPNREQSNLNEEDSYTTRNMLNTATYYDDLDNSLTYGIPLGAYYTLGSSMNESKSLRGQININKRILEDHSINMALITEIREEKYSSYGKNYYGYDEDTNSGKTVNPTEYYKTVYGWEEYIGSSNNSITKYRHRYLSYVASGAYSFKNRYFVSGSIRFDDYNMLGASRKDRAIPLWSAGLRWKVLDEPFIKVPEFLSKLDVRITYGKGGSSPVGGLGNNNAVINLSTDYYTDLPTAGISTPANSKLKWEITKTLNFGIDFGFLNDRIGGSLEYYTKKSYDILTNMPYNPTYGYPYLRYNSGTLSGHGVDFDLSVKLIKGEFNWTSNFNLSYNTNKVTHSNYEASTLNEFMSGYLIKGKSLSSIYAYRWAGLDSQGQSQIYGVNGEIIGSDVNSTNIDIKSLKYMGTTTAPYFGGFSNSFSWKNFELNTRITYSFGHVFRKPMLKYYPQYKGTHYGAIGKNREISTRWQKSGDEEITNVPGLANINFNSYSRYNNADINILPADHIRLQQVSLAYNVPLGWLNKKLIKNLSVSFSARNLGILWRKNNQGYDPQYLSTENYGTLTPSRSYTISLNASF